MRLIDFAASEIAPDQIKAAGYDGVVAYVSESRPGATFGASPITREYTDALRVEGLQIVSNFQYGGPGGSVPSHFMSGFAGGVADAQTAVRLHATAGGPHSAPIFFSIDEDIDFATWKRVAVEWFRGINSVLGVDRTGIYGNSRVCAWAVEDGTVGRSTTPGRRWVWQTKAWSCGESEPMAVLYRDVIDTASNPGPLVGNTRVNANEVLAADFGQWSLDRPIPPAVPPGFDESSEIRSPHCGSRGGVDVLWFVLHTQEGDSRSARDLAYYLSRNDNELSYHYAVDNDGQVYNIVDTDLRANSCLEPGDSKSLNLTFAGSWAHWSRQAWFDRMQHGIDVAAYIAARDTRRYKLQTRVISPEEAERSETGITDHNGVAYATRVGTHTDVGPGFPWDYFRHKLREYAGETPPAQATPTYSGPVYPGFAITQDATGVHVVMIQDRSNIVAKAGLLVDGEFTSLTSRAVTAFQISRGLAADGEVGVQTWEALFSDRGRADRVEHVAEARAAAAPTKYVTGPGITTSVAMESADLGILRWDPDRRAVAAMFGDNFEFHGMRGDWQSPSMVMYDNDYNVVGVPASNGAIKRNARRRQLWPYRHNNPEYSTILPCDFIRIGGWWHVAVIVTKGLGNELRTEFHRSRDLVTWEVQPELVLPHRPRPLHPGNTMLTFDRIGDYVYIFGTGGLARDRGIWMWRNPANQFPRGWWEPWGWDGFRWDWGIPNEGTPILEGRYGELSFRYLQGNCVLSYFDAGGYRQQARTVQEPEHNWRDRANVVDYVYGVRIPNPYGGYISPLSRLNKPNGMHFWVSQWDGIHPTPYRVYMVRETLRASGPRREARIEATSISGNQ